MGQAEWVGSYIHAASGSGHGSRPEWWQWKQGEISKVWDVGILDANKGLAEDIFQEMH